MDQARGATAQKPSPWIRDCCHASNCMKTIREHKDTFIMQLLENDNPLFV